MNETILTNLNRLPNKKDFHIWADYIELLCLVNPDGIITKGDIIDRLQDSEDLLPSVHDDDEFEELIASGNERGDDEPISKRRDKQEQQIADWFQHLAYREGQLEAFYPFILSKKTESLTLVRQITTKHKFYIFFLLASNLRYLPRNTFPQLTRAFESISSMALKQMLPESAEVHLFRPPGNTENKHYKGNLRSRITILAKDLRETIRLRTGDISEHDSGDAGLDVIGWVPVGDETTSGLLCVFGQCACTEEWDKKQHSSSVDTWRSIINFTAPPINMVFIPFCFREANGEWWRLKDIHQSIVIDRIRFMYFLRQQYQTLEPSAYSLVDKFLLIKEPLV